MKLITALLPICALVLPCALSAETFEGKVSMKMASPSSKDGSQTMDLSIKEGFMRVDIVAAKGAGAMITDFKNQQVIILMPQQKMYMVQPIPQPGQYPRPDAAAPKATLEKTGVTEIILGYECTKYIVTTADSSSEIWATDQLGTFAGLPHGGGPGRPREAPQAWESTLKGGNFFPMRVVTTSKGKAGFRLEVTSVTKTSLSDSLFIPPGDWRKLDLGAMMGGAMPGGFPGAQHPDGNN